MELNRVDVEIVYFDEAITMLHIFGGQDHMVGSLVVFQDVGLLGAFCIRQFPTVLNTSFNFFLPNLDPYTSLLARLDIEITRILLVR